MNLEKQKTQVAWLSVASNSLLVVLKIVVGLLIGSISVISEAIHSAIDLMAALIALFAVKQASKPADEDHHYGHGKFENVSGTLEALLIFVAAGWIIVEAIGKFRSPAPVEQPGWGVAVMLFSAIVNTVVSEMLFRVGRKTESIALEADAWHLRTDVYTSLGVMAGLLAIWVAGRVYPGMNVSWIDPVAAFFVAALIIKAAYDLTLKAALDLFDKALPEADLQWIRSVVLSSGAIKGYHRLKTRKAGKEHFIEFHLVVDPAATVLDSHQLTDRISERIKERFPGSHITIHVEPCDHSCSEACLSGCLLK